MGASKSKDDEYIELARMIKDYAKENGTLPGTSHPRYRDICNLRRGIKTGRIAADRKSVVWINENFPEMVYEWEDYRRKIESLDTYNGKLNKKLLDNSLRAMFNEMYPERVYIGSGEIHACLLALRIKNENTKSFVLSEEVFVNVSKYLKNGKELALSYSDYVVLSMILYGYRDEISYMGREETVGSCCPCVNSSDGYIELYFKLLQYPDLDIYLNDFLDNVIYMDEKVYNSAYGSNVDPMRNIICMYDYYSGKTLDETGKQFNISRERVRQILSRSSRRLIKKYRNQLEKIMEGR